MEEQLERGREVQRKKGRTQKKRKGMKSATGEGKRLGRKRERCQEMRGVKWEKTRVG